MTPEPREPARDQFAETVSTEHPAGGPVGGRKEVGSAASSQRHPPHVGPNAEDAPIQEELPAESDSPVPPANASGRDRFSTREKKQGIDPASAYDQRPAENKDTPPSETGGA